MLRGETSGGAGVRGNTRKLLDMDEKFRVTNGRRGKEEATVWECGRYKGKGSLHSHFKSHSLQYNSEWKNEEAPVYLSRNEMETIITQDSGMCLLVYRHPGTGGLRPELPSLCTDTAWAGMLWLQTQLPTETVKGVDSQATASPEPWMDSFFLEANIGGFCELVSKKE